MPLGGRHHAADDTGVRLGDVLHGRGTLELHGAVDRLGDLGWRRSRRRRGTGQQDADHDQDGREQERRNDAVQVEQLRAAGAAGVVSQGYLLG